MLSGKYKVFRSHPDLTSAIDLVEQMLDFDEGFRKIVSGLKSTNLLTDIENPLVRIYIEGKLGWCLERLQPYKTVIQTIAEELYKREELTGDEVYALFDSFMQKVRL